MGRADRRQQLRWGIWLIVFLLLLLAMRNVRIGDAVAVLQTIEWGQILLLILLNGWILAAGTARWWALLAGFGHHLPFLPLLAHRIAGFGVSFITPGPQFGGEPVQILLCEQHNVPRPVAIASVSLERSLELMINFGFLLLGAGLVLRAGVGRTALSPITILFIFAVFLLPPLYILLLAGGKRPLTRTLSAVRSRFTPPPPWFARLFAAITGVETELAAFCRRSARFLWIALLLSIAGWTLLIAEFGLMFAVLGAPLSPVQLITLLTAARLAILLPLPGGLGSLEAALIWTLTEMGFAPSIAAGALLLVRLRDFSLALAGIWWFRRRLPYPPPEPVRLPD